MTCLSLCFLCTASSQQTWTKFGVRHTHTFGLAKTGVCREIARHPSAVGASMAASALDASVAE